MAPADPPPTVPGAPAPDTLVDEPAVLELDGRRAVWGPALGGADGVSRVLAGLSAQPAHTMVLCGLSDVRAVPRDTVTPAR